MNRRAFQSFLLCLAFLASGLLTVAPSISRALGASQHGGWAALCSASGLKWVHLAGSEPAVPSAPHHHDGLDCEYCLLLGHAATPPVLAMPTLLQPAHALLAWPLREASIDHRHPSGLGSRGPPRTLA